MNPSGFCTHYGDCEECKKMSGQLPCLDSETTSVYDAYPGLKDDMLISLWKRCSFFLRDRAEQRQGQQYFITLKENLVQDYGWMAEASIGVGGMEDGTTITYKGWGLEAHEAMLVLFDVLKRDLPEKE